MFQQAHQHTDLPCVQVPVASLPLVLSAAPAAAPCQRAVVAAVVLVPPFAAPAASLPLSVLSHQQPVSPSVSDVHTVSTGKERR